MLSAIALLPSSTVSLSVGKKQSFFHSSTSIHFQRYWRFRTKIPVQKCVLETKKDGVFEKGRQQMLVLCGLGFMVNGFRCFPWLGMNFHMANNLSMQPSTLQMVQSIGNLPLGAKPLYGILSDALYINGAHRIPYISIGVIIQILAWGSLALSPVARETLPVLMVCILLSNLGASIAEVAKEALVAEYGQHNAIPGLQSYAFTALAAGGVLGNLLGGFILLRTKQSMLMFLTFAALLSVQLATTLATREESLGLPQMPSTRKNIGESVRKQFSDLLVVVRRENIARPLAWIITSIVIVPVLSGSVFCYQTQCLNLSPSVIGMSKVTGQLLLFLLTLVYGRFWKDVPMRRLVGILQTCYACSLILDLILVKQLNLTLGIPNETFALCFSGAAEILAQFKLLPFHVLFAKLAPPGCEGSLMSFLASALCLSSIASGFLGVGLSSILGITSGDYSKLPTGICIQFFAALLPMLWIHLVPEVETAAGKGSTSNRSDRVRRLAFDPIQPWRHERAPGF